MPHLEEDELEEFEIPEIPVLEGEDEEGFDEELDSAPIALAVETHESIVQLDDEPEEDGLEDGEEFPSVPVADMEDEALEAPASSSKTRGGKASRTTTPAKTPRSSKKAAAPKPATSSRKRKAADNEPAAGLPAKRTSHGRAAANKAEEAIKEAAAPRKKADASAKEEKPKGKRGRKKQVKIDEEDDAGEEWEVEEVIESGVDGDTKQHLYLVKWKGFSEQENTWEPKKNLAHATDLLEAFEANRKKTRVRKPAAKKKAKAAPKKATQKKAPAKAPSSRPRGRPRKKA